MTKPPFIDKKETPYYQYGLEMVLTQIYKLGYAKILAPRHTHQIPILDQHYDFDTHM